MNRINGQPALVTSYNDGIRIRAAAVFASWRYRLKPPNALPERKNVLDICQKLYETHNRLLIRVPTAVIRRKNTFAGRQAVM